jgi:hypothetical protein
VPRLSLSDEFLDGSRDVLDRHVRIDAVLVEQIDRLDAKAPQRAVDCPPNVLGPARDAVVLAGLGIDVEAELGGDDDPVPNRPEASPTTSSLTNGP